MSRQAAILCRALPALAILLLVLASLPFGARAERHRRPFAPGIGLGYGFDNNFGAAGCTNYACAANKCYDGHTGSDFPLGLGTEVLAGAPGVVVEVHQGCADWGYLGNPCGGRCGNYVRLQHADGTRSLYCHMKNGAMVVSVNDRVGCGQKLGLSASSGSSTGYHLHFGWTSGSTRDPFSGGCATGGGWVNQGPYTGTPGTDCSVQCQCSPAEVQTQGCGRCGSQTRTCEGSCQWGGWSGCGGEGPCSPGQAESRTCCDCGSQTRTCAANCQWQGYSECAGPSPVGSPLCATGALGDCAAGVTQCMSGCLTCVQTNQPSTELCDGLDNDCDGETDEGATEIGASRPPFGAELVDFSVPSALVPGEVAYVWARFRNVGANAWPGGATWLAAAPLSGGGASGLWVADKWSAWDAPSLVATTVPPGGEAVMSFPIAMPDTTPATTRFTLVVEGASVTCPSPRFEVAPVVLAAPATGGKPSWQADAGSEAEAAEAAGQPDTAVAGNDDASDDDQGANVSPDGVHDDRGESGCAGRTSSEAGLALLLVLGLLWRRVRTLTLEVRS